MATGSRTEPPDVLIIDDDPAVVAVLARVLDELGWSARSVGSAEEALELLRTDAFALILLDIDLPGMTGFQALERIAGLSKAPVLLMSGSADEEFRKDALLLGAKGLLRKPFELSELKTRLSGLLA